MMVCKHLVFDLSHSPCMWETTESFISSLGCIVLYTQWISDLLFGETMLEMPVYPIPHSTDWHIDGTYSAISILSIVTSTDGLENLIRKG